MRGGAKVNLKWEDYEVKEIEFIPDNGGEFTLEFPKTQKSTIFRDSDDNVYNIVDAKITIKVFKQLKLFS